VNITPLDIKQRQFRLKFRGFDIREVDSFLEEVTASIEDMVRENAALREDKASLESQLVTYKDAEKALRDTLLAAQKMAEDMKATSERDASLRLKEAELGAEKILMDAKNQLTRLEEEITELKRLKQRFTLKVRGVIDDHLKMLDYEEREEGTQG